MKSLAISAAAAALTLAGCGADSPTFDPDSQWGLTLHVELLNDATGHIDVTRSVGGPLEDCTSSSCVYAIDVEVNANLHAMEDDDEGSAFIGWSGDCTGTGDFVAGTDGFAGEAVDCTATFDTAQNAVETCDNQLDDDDSGELDCSDPLCADDLACDPDQFGDFADDDGLDYAQVGASTCGFLDPMEAWSLTPGGLLWPTLGENTDAFFAMVDGELNQATATNLTIFGIPGYTCTLFESEFGDPIHVVFSFNCTLTGNPTCSQGFNAPRP